MVTRFEADELETIIYFIINPTKSSHCKSLLYPESAQ